MSLLLSSSSSINNHHHHHYFSNPQIQRSTSPTRKQIPPAYRSAPKLNEHPNDNTENDQVPFGVVHTMKQRLLDKANESLLLNNNSTTNRHSLLKPSTTRITSNENLPQNKSLTLPLKQTTRLSRSQDNLVNSNNNNHNLESFAAYLQPKQDVIIVERTKSDDDTLAISRHAYNELHMDEVPKPGTVTTVKNMFERQIRLSRYDSDRVSNTSISHNSRVNYPPRESSSPNRSRSISPNDMALRQRRSVLIHSANAGVQSLPPAVTSFPDVVISHTPLASIHSEITKANSELIVTNEQKKRSLPSNTIPDETMNINTNQNHSNILVLTNSSSDTDDYQPLDFKSRLALFNRTNTIEQTNGNSYIPNNIKKHSVQNHKTSPASPNFLTKPVVHHLTDKKDNSLDSNTRPNITTTKSVTFFGGAKVNGAVPTTLTTSVLQSSFPVPNDEQSFISASSDSFPIPDVIGGNIKLSKSSIYSGAKKDTRVQFIDDVDTFEYPSFSVVMAELGYSLSDDDDDDDLGNDDDSSDDENIVLPLPNGKTTTKANHTDENINLSVDDIDDDELERLATINANFNSKNYAEKSSQSKGTLHTFRPSYLDQYELGKQHGSLTNSQSSDILSREKPSSISNYGNHSISKQEKPMVDMTNNIQWSSISTTTDLLF